MAENYKIKVKIIPQKEKIFFWGKSCEDILKAEFKDFTAKEYSDITVYISENCPYINKQQILNYIIDLKGYKSLADEKEYIKIINNNTNAKGDKQIEDKILSVEINKEKIEINEILRKRIIEKHIDNGVFIANPQNTYIDYDVKIEKGVNIFQNNFLTKKTIIKKDCILMPNNNINNTTLCEGVTATASTFNEAIVGKGTTVGPNAYLRPKSKVGENCKIGDFVEVKNANIGNGTKVSHLAYVGDADVGNNCNIGCGVIFVNYNGKTKNRSYVGNNCFIGSNCNVIAPVKIEDKVFVAAGTSITKDVPTEALCIGRVRQEVKDKMALKYLKLDK